MLPWTGHNAYSLSSSSDQSSPANSTAPLFPPTGTNTVNPGNTATYDTQRSSITPITNPEPSNPSPPPSLLPPPPPSPAPIQQPLPAPAPITLSSTLHFLQTEHRRYARDRNEWEIERAEMRARVALLEGEKRGNEGALRDLARRCRMLEGVLRAERSKFLSLTNQSNSPSASGTSSPLQGPMNSNSPPIGQPTVPVEPHHLSQSSEPREESVKQDGVSPQPTDAGTTSNEQVSSTAEPALPASTESLAATNKLRAGAAMISNPLLSRVANGYSGSSGSGAAGTSIGGGATGIASSGSGSHYGMPGGVSSGNGSTPIGVPGSSATRDLRGKARSRDYLKQCLQEITYLTASTTLNPLSSTSFAAPGVPRPRKVLLPVPPAGIPAPAPLDHAKPTSLSNQQTSADSVKKDALPAGMYLLKGSKVPISITASSSNSLSASTPSPVQSEFAPASTYTPPGDSASVFIPLQREPSERGRGSGRSISVEMEGEREGINERRLAPGGLGEERKRAAGENSGAWLNSTSSILPASTIAQERGVDSMTGTMPAVAAANVIDNRLEGIKLPTTTSDPTPSPLPTTAAETITHHLPSPPRSPSPAPPVFVSPLSSPAPSSASVSTSYINANNAPSSFTTKPTTLSTSKPTASSPTAISNGGVDSDLNSLILETTRKEDPSPPESNESGLVWEHDNGSLSMDAPAAILDGDKLEAEVGKDSTTTTKSSGGSKSKKNKKTAGTLPLVGDTTAVESLP